MRCTVDLLTPNSPANLRHDQCVLPSLGCCCTRRTTRACTAGVAVRGLLPRCRPSRPANRSRSKRLLQRAMVAALVRMPLTIALQTVETRFRYQWDTILVTTRQPYDERVFAERSCYTQDPAPKCRFRKQFTNRGQSAGHWNRSGPLLRPA